MTTTYFREPYYYHRDYSKDLSVPSKTKAWSDQTGIERLQRVTAAALPFASFYKPSRFPLTLGMGSLRVFNDLSDLATTLKNSASIDSKYIAKMLITTLSVASLIGTILAHPVGMIITTSQDLLTDLIDLYSFVQKGEYDSALEVCASILNNSLYMALIVYGGLGIAIASLTTQILIGVAKSHEEFQQGRYLEAIAYIGMAMIRGNQLEEQIKISRDPSEKGQAPKFPAKSGEPTISKKDDGIVIRILPPGDESGWIDWIDEPPMN